jgi:hypothetical protein
MPQNAPALRLRSRLTCPHCWHGFGPEQLLYVAEHPDLVNDPRLGRDAPQRFLSSRFTVDGAAVDARGFPCHRLACPECHLEFARPLLELEPVFLSILGAPASGKSYLLASMTWQLRRTLPQQFALSFGDADPQSNFTLNEYESLQFLNPNQDEIVAIAKTGEQGDWYDEVMHPGQNIRYLRPYLFSLTTMQAHPNHRASSRVSRVMCLYDNAGEHFLPGADTTKVPATRHLALSRALMFVFDPTQDPRFRQACVGKTTDMQMVQRSERTQREARVHQETILHEAALRVRRYAGISQTAKYNRPLIVVVSKYDAWMSLLDNYELQPPWRMTAKGDFACMELETVEQVSQRVRKLLWKLTPEFVGAVEGFAENVLYVPTSATGCSPSVDPKTGTVGFRPRDLRPTWVEVPLLYVMAKYFEGLIPLAKPKANSVTAADLDPNILSFEAASHDVASGPTAGRKEAAS